MVKRPAAAVRSRTRKAVSGQSADDVHAATHPEPRPHMPPSGQAVRLR